MGVGGGVPCLFLAAFCEFEQGPLFFQADFFLLLLSGLALPLLSSSLGVAVFLPFVAYLLYPSLLLPATLSFDLGDFCHLPI